MRKQFPNLTLQFILSLRTRMWTTITKELSRPIHPRLLAPVKPSRRCSLSASASVRVRPSSGFTLFKGAIRSGGSAPIIVLLLLRRRRRRLIHGGHVGKEGSRRRGR